MRILTTSVLTFASLLWANGSFAATLCSSLPNPLYLQVSDTEEPVMKALGQQLRASTVNPITLIYYLNGSCTNIDAMYNGTKLTVNPSYVPSQTDIPGWDPTQPSPPCTIDPAGVPLDLASSEVYINACTQTAMPANIASFDGAIRPYVFVTTHTATPQAITAAEAYFVFGFGAADQVTPWNDPSFMFIRPVAQPTLVTMAASIQVPPAKWQGVQVASPGGVVTSVAQSTSPGKTIGILATDVYDSNRTTLSSLAFQTFRQNHAYYPDSGVATRDKRNVRDGHYVIWSGVEWLAPVDASNALVNPRAEYVLDLLTDVPATPTPDFDPLAVMISTGMIPECAMKVTRTVEGGDLSLYSSADPCGCFFESQVATAPASCTACASNATCGGGVCRHGFCEAQ